jgi:hypothetical protein
MEFGLMTDYNVSTSAEQNAMQNVDYLRRLLGDTFVTWVLADPGEQLTPQQLEVAAGLADILRKHVAMHPELPTEFAVMQLMSYPKALSTTLLNYSRRYAGGTMEAITESSADDLLAAFHAFAIECYGEMLLPTGRFGRPPDFHHYVKTEAGRNLVQAIRNEGIFPLGPENDYTALGEDGVADHFRSLIPGHFASSLIWCAWRLAKLDTGRPSPAQLATKIPIALEQLRSCVSGQPTVVTAVCSLTGVRLPDDAEISGTWGRIRPARPEDHPASLRDLVDKRTVTTTDAGDQIEISDAGDVIFETNVRVKVEVKDDKTGWSSTGVDDFGDLIDRVRLALALAITRATKPVTFCIWATTLFPMASLEPFLPLTDPQSMVGRTPTLLTIDEIASWEQWINIVMTADMSRLKVAITRTLRAMTERRDPNDKLIDAVIAWESLFGAANESTLRVSASLARLLHSADEDREAARKGYGNIYQARSDIVHANETNRTAAQIDEYGRAAIEASLKAITLLLTTHSSLLDLKSSTRSTRIILGADSQSTQVDGASPDENP